MNESIIYMLEISWEKTGAIVIIGILLFIGFYKELFLLNNQEKKHLKQLQEKTGNSLSGRALTAIIGLSFLLVSVLIGYLFYLD